MFAVSDGTFTFFVAVEKVTRQHLPCQYSSEKCENIKQLVIKAISEDCDVQFYWTLISQVIDEDAIELLDIADVGHYPWFFSCFNLAGGIQEIEEN